MTHDIQSYFRIPKIKLLSSREHAAVLGTYFQLSWKALSREMVIVHGSSVSARSARSRQCMECVCLLCPSVSGDMPTLRRRCVCASVHVDEKNGGWARRGSWEKLQGKREGVFFWWIADQSGGKVSQDRKIPGKWRASTYLASSGLECDK